MFPLQGFPCWSDWRWPFLVLSGKTVECSLFLRLSPPGDRWCDVLGFAPASSLQFLNTSEPPRLLSLVPVNFALSARPAISLVVSPDSQPLS